MGNSMPSCACGWRIRSAQAFRAHRLCCNGGSCGYVERQATFKTRTPYDANVEQPVSPRVMRPRTKEGNGGRMLPASDWTPTASFLASRAPHRGPRRNGEPAPLAIPVGPKKANGERPLFDERVANQSGRYPCLVHGKVGCLSCSKPNPVRIGSRARRHRCLRG